MDKLKLVDTHAHVNFSAFKDDADEILKKCSDENVGVINIGSQFSTSKRAVEMAEKYETGVWAVIGLHPSHLVEYDYEEEGIKFKSVVEKFDAQKYRELAKSKKVVAIGECGLDYHYGEENKEIQMETFREEIKLAVELDLPLVVHCRNAYKDVLEILTEEKKKYGEKLRGVMHSYLGRLSYAHEFNKLGFLIAFNGVITYARDYDKVIREINLENILVETDCPWLTPVPHRGERNEPIYVKFVAQKIAEIKNIDVSEAENVTTQNAKKLFLI
ncbi:MAG: TatD family hydrolase [Parcubacteria group bacterium]